MSRMNPVQECSGAGVQQATAREPRQVYGCTYALFALPVATCNNLSNHGVYKATDNQMLFYVCGQVANRVLWGAIMRGILKTIAVVFLSATFVAAGFTGLLSASAGSCAFLYIPGIHGNADDPTHRNWIEILSCDWGSVPPPRGSMVSDSGKGPAGMLCFGDFSFLKYVDDSSADLAEYCSRGVQFSHIRLELSGSKMRNFKYLVLRKVKVLSVRPGKTDRDGSKTEVVTVGFRQVEYQ